MSIVKRVFWIVFIIVFIAAFILVSKGINNSPEENINEETFACENDNSVQSRVYVILLGLGNHNTSTFVKENELMMKDPKTKGILTYEYDEEKELENISNEFLAELDSFIAPYDIEELVIVGVSTGGIISSYSAHKLSFQGIIELHTIAAPLKGYGLKDTNQELLGDRTGLKREIALGFEQFITPPKNVKVYHHKMIEDPSLLSWCGDRIDLCNTLEIENNNLEGSKEFLYGEQYNHDTVMNAVLKKVIECRE